MNNRSITGLLASLGVVALTACGSAVSPGGHSSSSNAPDGAVPASESAPRPAPAPSVLSSNSTAMPTVGVATAVRGSAGVKAFIDPVTGDVREPTEAEQQAADVAAAAAKAGGTAQGNANAQVTVPIVGKAIGSGMVEYELGQRGMVDEVACVQADGSVSGNCPKTGGKATGKTVDKAGK